MKVIASLVFCRHSRIEQTGFAALSITAHVTKAESDSAKSSYTGERTVRTVVKYDGKSQNRHVPDLLVFGRRDGARQVTRRRPACRVRYSKPSPKRFLDQQ
ncbi:hypothetical protein BVI434_1970004 [Burkholderia vietnamiensis]|nr:hypothetical protein BVI434_1970004 [Burkholderia vietnamiensis]